jgi:hypothetical protein
MLAIQLREDAHVRKVQRLALEEQEESKRTDRERVMSMADTEVKRRLRALGQPVT